MRKRLLLILILTAPAWAQSAPPSRAADSSGALVAGDREIGLWVAGGHSVSGGRSDTGVFNAGARYGWVLTQLHGSGPLRGSFEYAVDAIPLYLIFQNTTVYGASFDPVDLKWNFAGARSVKPFLEIAGGVLFTREAVPRFTNDVNFTSQAAFGAHFGTGGWRPTVQVRYVHISNAGLATPNPGINTVQLQVGVNRFQR
jgi:hypothetical protein